MSYIVKSVTMPNGSVGIHHRPIRLEIDDTGAMVIINSHATDDTERLVWQDRYSVPMSEVSGYPETAMSWLCQNGIFASGEVLRDPTPLETTKARMKALIDARRASLIGGGAMTPAGRVDTDETSIRNILGAYQSAVAALMAGATVEYSWRMSDNSLVTLNASQVIAMGNAVLKHTEDCYKASWALKDQLENAGTESEVWSIDLNSAAWPV